MAIEESAQRKNRYYITSNYKVISLPNFGSKRIVQNMSLTIMKISKLNLIH